MHHHDDYYDPHAVPPVTLCALCSRDTTSTAARATSCECDSILPHCDECHDQMPTGEARPALPANLPALSRSALPTTGPEVEACDECGHPHHTGLLTAVRLPHAHALMCPRCIDELRLSATGGAA